MSNVMSGVKNMRHPERGKLKIKWLESEVE